MVNLYGNNRRGSLIYGNRSSGSNDYLQLKRDEALRLIKQMRDQELNVEPRKSFLDRMKQAGGNVGSFLIGNYPGAAIDRTIGLTAKMFHDKPWNLSSDEARQYAKDFRKGLFNLGKYKNYSTTNMYRELVPSMARPFPKLQRDKSAIEQMVAPWISKEEEIYKNIFGDNKFADWMYRKTGTLNRAQTVGNLGYEFIKDPAALAGLATQIVDDPLTYLSFGGAKGGIKGLELGAKGVLNAATKKAIVEGGETAARKIAQEGLEAAGRQVTKSLVDDMARILMTSADTGASLKSIVGMSADDIAKRFPDIATQANKYIDDLGRSARMGKISLTREGAEELATRKNLLDNLLKSGRLDDQVDDIIRKTNEKSGQTVLDFASIDDVDEMLKTAQRTDVGKEMITKEALESVVGKGFGDVRGLLDYGGLKLDIPFTKISKTIVPYSKFEKLGFYKVGEWLLNSSPKTIQKAIKGLKTAFLPRGNAPQKLADLFNDETRLLPRYEINKLNTRIDDLMKDLGIDYDPEILRKATGRVEYSKLVDIIESVDEPTRKRLLGRLERLGKEYRAKIIRNIKEMDNIPLEEYQKVVTGAKGNISGADKISRRLRGEIRKLNKEFAEETTEAFERAGKEFTIESPMNVPVDELRGYIDVPENVKTFSNEFMKEMEDLRKLEIRYGLPVNKFESKYGNYVSGLTRLDRIDFRKVDEAAKLLEPDPRFTQAKHYRGPIERTLIEGPNSAAETSLATIWAQRGKQSIDEISKIRFLQKASDYAIKPESIDDWYRTYNKRIAELRTKKVPKGSVKSLARKQTKLEFGFDPDNLKEIKFNDPAPTDGLKFTPEVADYLDRSTQLFTEKNLGKFVRMLDGFTNWWKSFATVIIPGFHSRNAQSNIFNLFLKDGRHALNPKRHAMAISMMAGDDGLIKVAGGKVLKYDEFMDLARRHGVFDLGFVGGDIAQAELNWIKQKYPKTWKEMAKKWFKLTPDGKLVQTGNSVGKAIENEARLTGFINDMIVTGNPEYSAKRVNEFLFNYRDISLFESTFAKRAFPFYTWSRKNIPLQWRNLFTQGRKFGVVPKVKEFLTETSRSGGYIDEDYEELEPHYYQELMAIPLPMKSSADKTIVYNPNYAFQDLTKVTPLDAMNLMHPLPRAAAELLTNYQFFRDAPITPYGSASMTEAPRFFDKLTFLPGVYEGKDKFSDEERVYINNYLNYLMNQIPALANIGKLAPQSKEDRAKVGLRASSILAGVKGFEFDPDSAEYWKLKDAIEDLEALKDYYQKRGLWEQ